MEVLTRHRPVLSNCLTISSMDNKLPMLLIEQLVITKADAEHSAEEWELLLRQARVAGVLSRLAFFWKEFSLFNPPDFVIPHLKSADKYWLSQNRIVNWEIYNLQQIFAQLQMPLILLKGSAYSAANLNAGLGRVFSDIDILVSKQRLQEVKAALKWRGWFPEQLDSYDKRYYEHWMHELPPMRHIQRGTTLDVHHNILPKTCRLCPNPEVLLEAAINIPETNYWVLAAEDMVLHSASHLFWGGEFENGLRDLSDIDLLLREFCEQDFRFWDRLLERAEALGLAKPLFFALRYTSIMLDTPVPEAIIQRMAFLGPKGINLKFMDFLFLRALRPMHPSCNDGWSDLARWLLYIRSHWLKMPLYLLLPHLSRKAWMRLTGKQQH